MSGRTDTKMIRITHRSVSAAREHVASLLIDWRLGHLTEDALLITSELATNVVKHAGKGIGEFFELEVKRRTGMLVIEVTDSYSWEMPEIGNPFPLAGEFGDLSYDPEADPEKVDEGGRGLVIVSALAENWGVRPRDSGKTVWAHLPIKSGGAP
ncbi:ATP-binding protein [Streptomyces niveiscabiei]|uniref:ATP-binding protein n=1 Tax=Streptomyces niveiscabiei TaxID=164115 RepID=UPI0038F7BC5B